MTPLRAVRRTVRPIGKRLQAMIRWRRIRFADAPPVFGNAKPKSGSHLLLQILDGFTRIMPYAYVRAEPVRTVRRQGGRVSENAVVSELQRIPHDVIGWGYVEAWPRIVAHLCQPTRVNFFLYRDPRDVLISHVFFATEMHEEHGMHTFYASLPDTAERLKVAITGIDRDGLRMVSVRQRYEAVFPWLQQPGVLCLRYEDLVGAPASALGRMLEEVERTGYRIPTPRPRALEILNASIQPRKSATFRSGRIGGWREYFSTDHKRLFKDVAGDLLQRLGYEQGQDW